VDKIRRVRSSSKHLTYWRYVSYSNTSLSRTPPYSSSISPLSLPKSIWLLHQAHIWKTKQKWIVGPSIHTEPNLPELPNLFLEPENWLLLRYIILGVGFFCVSRLFWAYQDSSHYPNGKIASSFFEWQCEDSLGIRSRRSRNLSSFSCWRWILKFCGSGILIGRTLC
jgi:hypothetical protein